MIHEVDEVLKTLLGGGALAGSGIDIITPGMPTHADQLSKSALPHRVEARVTLADGKRVTRELTLDQGTGGQRRTFRAGEVTAVRFTLESACQASASKQVAIAEIEFFGPSNAN